MTAGYLPGDMIKFNQDHPSGWFRRGEFAVVMGIAQSGDARHPWYVLGHATHGAGEFQDIFFDPMPEAGATMLLRKANRPEIQERRG
jgi:hypothetical protein